MDSYICVVMYHLYVYIYGIRINFYARAMDTYHTYGLHLTNGLTVPAP